MEMELVILVVLTLLSAKPTQPIRQSNQLLLSVAGSMDQELLSRNKRQLVSNPQGFNVPNAKLNIPVPVNIPFYPGENVHIDNCRRDEVLVESAYYSKPMCMKLLHRGNCMHDQVVLMDPVTKKGYCSSRLCPPDRIFVHATQLCHDSQDSDICPGGRELYNTAHGSAICDCPDGTTESSNGMYGDVCEVLLSENRLCPKGQVYWFRDFNSHPQCLPDPCKGSNLNRRINSLPFVPSQSTGQCFQLGQTTGVCQPGLIYALHLPSLKGVCETLENLGYDVLTREELDALNRLYGITIVKNNALSSSFGQNLLSTSVGSNVPINFINNNALIGQSSFDARNQDSQFTQKQIQSANYILSDYGLTFLRSLGFKNPPVPGILVYHVTIRPSGEVVTHIHPYNRNIRSVDENEIGETIIISNDDLKRLLEDKKLSKENSSVVKAILLSGKNHGLPYSTEGSSDNSTVLPGDLISSNTVSRKKRQVQAHASPSNVFETKLQSCSPGAARDLNAKCRDTVLPATIPKSRGVRAAPPVSPMPSCPAGQAYNFRRMCASSSSIQNSNLARGLG